jgi:hypothetical protein
MDIEANGALQNVINTLQRPLISKCNITASVWRERIHAFSQYKHSSDADNVVQGA